jgi:hypothetical protein
MAFPCVFIPAGCFQNWFHYNSSWNYKNCWWIVILWTLFAWHLYILDFDTDFLLYIIPFMAIPCIGILTLQISDKNTIKIVLYSIKLIKDCHILHSICKELAYMTTDNDFREGTSNGSSLRPSCSVAFQNDWTLICLVLQWIDCSFSYCAFPMHGIDISVLLRYVKLTHGATLQSSDVDVTYYCYSLTWASQTWAIGQNILGFVKH